MMSSQIECVLKRIKSSDIRLLKIIVDQGPIWHGKIKRIFGKENGKFMLLRLRNRGLVSPIRYPNGYYQYDISELGVEVLEYLKERD